MLKKTILMLIIACAVFTVNAQTLDTENDTINKQSVMTEIKGTINNQVEGQLLAMNVFNNSNPSILSKAEGINYTSNRAICLHQCTLNFRICEQSNPRPYCRAELIDCNESCNWF